MITTVTGYKTTNGVVHWARPAAEVRQRGRRAIVGAAS